MVDIATLAVLGTDLSSVVGSVSVPIAPTGVQAVAGDTRAVVNWTAPNQGQPTSYTVTASPGGMSATVSALNTVITGLTNGTAYTFSVVATNSAGNGAASSASNSVTPSVAPGGLSAITGLAAWLDAGQISGPPGNGAAVGSWPGASGNGEVASQASTNSKPTFVSSWANSKPALNFSGQTSPGKQFMTTNIVPLAGFGGGTLFLVADITASTNSTGVKDYRFISNETVSSKDSGFDIDAQGTTNAMRVYDDNGTFASSAAISTATPYVFSITAPGFSFLNGTKTAQFINALRANGAAFNLGITLTSTTRNLIGDIAELLYFNRPLTDSERHQVESYLGTKYNITMAVQ